MRIHTALTSLAAAGLMLAGPAHAEVMLVNFGESAYTTDGSNIWQTIDVNTTGSGSTAGPLNTAPLALVDTDGVATGITLQLSGIEDGGLNIFARSDAASATNETFDWFDSSVAAQRETYSFGPNQAGITYTFTGFQTDEIVTIEGLAFREGSGTRRLDVVSSVNGTIVDDAPTNNGSGVTFTDAGLTGASSYSVTAQKPFNGDGFPASFNALRVQVVPEPASLALLAAGSLCLLPRRRR
jgi:hypothetical protein